MEKQSAVLVIIEKADLLQIAIDVLKEQKYRVVTATTSHEARLKLGNEDFHLIVLDMDIPNFKARQYVEGVRRKEGLKNMKDTIPILILGEKSDVYSHNFSQMDYIKYLATPFSKIELKKKLLTFLGHSNVIAENTRVIEKDEFLITEGGTNHEMYWILEGEFIITKSNNDNKEVIIGKVFPGEVVGEMSFLDNLPRSASVRALINSEVLVIPHKKFVDVLDNQPRWFRSLMQTLSSRLRTANTKITNKNVAEDKISGHDFTKDDEEEKAS